MFINKVDGFLNTIAMYRLVLYGLIVLAIVSITFGFLGMLPFAGLQMVGTLILLIASCWVTNQLIAKLLKVQTNIESEYITAFILFFVLSPIQYTSDIPVVIGAGALAMASKYFIAVNKKHIFNPAGFAAFALGLFGFGNAIWWAGSAILLPFVTLIGLLVVRKIRRFRLFFSFMAAAIVTITVVNLRNGVSVSDSLFQTFTSWPIIFFATIMLTEPLTTPPTSKLQMIYGALVGLLFGQQFHIGPFFSTPEFALIIGNMYSYIVSPKGKVILTLKEKIRLTPDTWEFAFSPDKSFSFKAGQYMEWTLAHKNPDSRGNRRYFTLASAPTGKDVRLGVKLNPEKASTFKKKLYDMKKGDTIVAGQLTGDFTLPADSSRKLAFIAGGIGVTPFRSIVQYLVDTNQKRDGVLFYTGPTEDSFAYKEFFDRVEKQTGIRVVYIITKQQNAPKNWKGKTGYMTDDIVKAELPDYKDRTFYLSGPNSMVDSYKSLLANLGVGKTNIVTDYFSGY